MIMIKRELGIESIIAIVLVVAILILVDSLMAHGGERVRCNVRPDNSSDDWHYRTKIPGYSHGSQDDKCWYIGERMKPREELYWSALPTAPSIMADPPKPMEVKQHPEFEKRWKGAPYGWEHKE